MFTAYISALLLLLAGASILTQQRAVRLRVPARLESIRWLTALLDELAREAQLSEQGVFHCRLALDEALTNIINHSYANRPNGMIDASIRASNGVCTISLTDFGEPYDPTRVDPPLTRDSLDEVRPGGLGLHLIRSVMDEVRYATGPTGNRLTMVKHIHPGE